MELSPLQRTFWQLSRGIHSPASAPQIESLRDNGEPVPEPLSEVELVETNAASGVARKRHPRFSCVAFRDQAIHGNDMLDAN
jgi:hypothetical protein